MKTRYPRSFPPDEASSWRRIRKYAVPRSMIERATERRLAGDWRGACAAANADVAFDLAAVAERYGGQTAARLEDDLRHLAPDLLRWHLPRYLSGRTTLRPGQRVLLESYGRSAASGPFLHAATPMMIDGPQRITLGFCELDVEDAETRGQTHIWLTSRYLWDVRHAAELRERCVDSGPAPVSGADAATSPDNDRVRDVFRAAGVHLDETPLPSGGRQYLPLPTLLEALTALPLAAPRLEPEARSLTAAGFGSSFQVPVGLPGAWPARLLLQPRQAPARDGLYLRLVQARGPEAALPMLPDACWRRLPDLDLLALGDITPGELHPLVSASLFPERAKPADGPPAPADQPPPPVRVRCRGGWHEVRSAGGRLLVPHSEQEERRELAMRALGGPVTGCFAAQQAWTSGEGRLPKALRAQRRDFFARVQHGDTEEVLRQLDAGMDPHVRDGRRRTLLHLLSLLDYQVLLPRLLEAGLDLEARDHHQRTPLHVAAGEGPVGLVHALLDAGARTDVVDHMDISLPSLIYRNKRKELSFLCDAVLRDHPAIDLIYFWGDSSDPWGELGD